MTGKQGEMKRQHRATERDMKGKELKARGVRGGLKGKQRTRKPKHTNERKKDMKGKSSQKASSTERGHEGT